MSCCIVSSIVVLCCCLAVFSCVALRCLVSSCVFFCCAVLSLNNEHRHLEWIEKTKYYIFWYNLFISTRQRCWTISSREILETRVVDCNNRSLTLRCFQGVVLCAFAEFVVYYALYRYQTAEARVLCVYCTGWNRMQKYIIAVKI